MKTQVARWLKTLGWDPRKIPNAIKELPTVRAERKAFKNYNLDSKTVPEFPLGSNYYIFGERSSEAGEASGHYFHQDLMVAREIYQRNPERHIDVGSRVDGFVAHVASFRDIEVIDVRPLKPTEGIQFIQADVMNLDSQFVGIADSVSCLHALEHFGLGRYGDPIDPDGWRQGFKSLTRMLKPNGILYLSVPTGQHQRVEFNAHRVFSLPFLRDVIRKHYVIERCAFITDSGDLLPRIDPDSPEAQRSFSADYGCSVWVLRRINGE